ncbi:MAG: hypothetical protein ACYTFX_05155, partial [Planctomycetota bacterium]
DWEEPVDDYTLPDYESPTSPGDTDSGDFDPAPEPPDAGLAVTEPTGPAEPEPTPDEGDGGEQVSDPDVADETDESGKDNADTENRKTGNAKDTRDPALEKMSAAAFDPKYRVEKVNPQWQEQVSSSLGKMETKNEQDIRIGQITMSSTVLVAGVFSAGYITWLMNSGALVASMLASVPTWMSFDPLPILESYNGLGGTEGSPSGSTKEDDKLEEKIQSLLD